MIGPMTQDDLFYIVTRFRIHQYVITADVAKMYRQVLVEEQQRLLQRIVRRDHPSETLRTYELSTVTYGTASALFLAVRCLRQLAKEEIVNFLVGAGVALSDFYVDDLLTDASTIQHARTICTQITALLSKGGFELRKWVSNEPLILADMDTNDNLTTINLADDDTISMLGLQWNAHMNTLKFTRPKHKPVSKVTKRVIHIELATNLTTETFLGTLKRFIARRGKPLNIYSDNATNFVGARQELEELSRILINEMSRNRKLETMAASKINWHFSPTRAPHFGGIWEARVKSIKFHLRRVVGEAFLTYEEMYTILLQIEAILNSRPLTPLSNDPNDIAVLTPGHFLIGDSLTSEPTPSIEHIPLNHLSRWQYVERLRQHFWARSSKKYLNELQQRNMWKKKGFSNIQPGSLVFIKEDGAAPLQWPVGRIEAVHPGQDGVVRAATVCTISGFYKRPVVRLCLFSLDNELPEDH